jgi:hypothetical protein
MPRRDDEWVRQTGGGKGPKKDGEFLCRMQKETEIIFDKERERERERESVCVCVCKQERARGAGEWRGCG